MSRASFTAVVGVVLAACLGLAGSVNAGRVEAAEVYPTESMLLRLEDRAIEAVAGRAYHARGWPQAVHRLVRASRAFHAALAEGGSYAVGVERTSCAKRGWALRRATMGLGKKVRPHARGWNKRARKLERAAFGALRECSPPVDEGGTRPVNR
ncbi:MAG: hypothetical protein ACR2OD_05390 [Gaiellaceae bacterium]